MLASAVRCGSLSPTYPHRMCLQGQKRLQMQLLLSCLCFLPCGWLITEQTQVMPIFQGWGRAFKTVLVKSQPVWRPQLVPGRLDLAHSCWVRAVSLEWDYAGRTYACPPLTLMRRNYYENALKDLTQTLDSWLKAHIVSFHSVWKVANVER